MTRDDRDVQKALPEQHAKFERQDRTIRWLMAFVGVVTVMAMVAWIYLPQRSAEALDRLSEHVRSQFHKTP